MNGSGRSLCSLPGPGNVGPASSSGGVQCGTAGGPVRMRGMTGRTNPRRKGSSPPSREPSRNDAPPPDAVAEVVTRFEAYARARAARDSLLPGARTGPWHEQRAFDDLQAAVARLRDGMR